MSNVAALRNGEWYQDLYGWSRILDLGSGCILRMVRLEAEGAGHVDDVVAYPSDEALPVEFIQVKFHVGTEQGEYSTESLMDLPPSVRRAGRVGRKSRAKSLLQKFWVSWKQLRDNAPGGALLILFSNWSWSRSDPLGRLISGRDGTLNAEFFTASETSAIGQARERWRVHLEAQPDEFEAFARALRFRLGSGSTRELEDMVRRVMAALCLQSDDNALKRAITQVGEWIRNGVETIEPPAFKEAVNRMQLRLPEADPAVVITLQTIERRTYESPSDHTVDWCDRFLPLRDGVAFPRGHSPIDAECWERDFLPELFTLKETLTRNPVRLLRLRGQARISAWIAVGRVFERRAGYVLEIDQYGQPWRTDVPAGGEMSAACAASITLGLGSDLAVAIAITNDVTTAVRGAIEAYALSIETLLVFSPTSGIGSTSISSPASLSAFVDSLRTQLGGHTGARGRIHLFYSGPVAGAAFLGHSLGAITPDVQLYEFTGREYVPSFLLRG